jgi:PAS domain S-box-containing protein
MWQDLAFPLTSRFRATCITVVFILWSVLWLTLPDYALRIFPGYFSDLWQWQSEKCVLYVATTVLLLFLAVRITKKYTAAQHPARGAKLRPFDEPGPIAIVRWDEDKRIRYANDALCQILGCRQSHLIGKDVTRLISTKPAFNFDHELQAGNHGILQRVELLRQDGIGIPVLRGFAKNGDTNECSAFFVDISELAAGEEQRLEVRQQLFQSEKAHALGQLAGGVAHNFNNELAVIVGYASMINTGCNSDEKTRRCAMEVLKAGERTRKLVNQLLAFSCKQPLDRETIEINRCLIEMQSMLRVMLGDHIELRVNSSTGDAWVELDSLQFQQAVFHLVANARDAMPRGGRLIIDVGHRRWEAGQSDRGRNRECVTIRISDTGIGMDDTTKTRIFDPFFTTKQHTGAVGLGLSTVYGIVKQNGGDISLTSILNAGSSFTMEFPRAQRKVAELVRMPAPKRQAVEGTVLLVEDLDPLREMMNEILRAEGLTVLPARDGLHAVELSRSNGAIDLVLTDVVMPRMNGPEAVRLIRKVHPEIKVIYSSGYADWGDSMEGDPIIWKPVRPETLIKTVQECLLGRSAPRGENSLAS